MNVLYVLILIEQPIIVYTHSKIEIYEKTVDFIKILKLLISRLNKNDKKKNSD